MIFKRFAIFVEYCRTFLTVRGFNFQILWMKIVRVQIERVTDFTLFEFFLLDFFTLR